MSKSRTGFHPVGSLQGAPYVGPVNRYYFAGAGGLNVGDICVLDVYGFANVVPRENDSNKIFLGAVVGVEQATKQDASSSTFTLNGTTSTLTLEKRGLVATAGWVYVADAPGTLYVTQGQKTYTQTNVGSCGNVKLGDDPTPANIGVSGQAFNTTTEDVDGTPAAAALKIVGLGPKDPDRYANTIVVVINKHVFDPGTGV